MSTLRISNIEAKADNSSPTVDEQLKFTNSTGDLMLYLDGRTSGITTVGINTTNQTIKFDANNNVMVTGIVTATEFHGTLAVGTSVTYGDNEKAYFGNGLDMSIYHDGTDSRISNGGGLTYILGDVIRFRNHGDSGTVLNAALSGVDLYASTAVKLSTNASGVNVSGILTATTFSGSGASLTGLTAGQIPNLAASKITSGTVATARLGSGTANSSTFLRGDQSWAAVTSTTINNNANNRIITGSGTANTLEGEANLTYNGSALALAGNDNQELKIGAGADLTLKADGSNSAIVHNGDGDLVILAQGSSENIKLQSAGYLHFFTSGNNERLRINNVGHVFIGNSTNNTNDNAFFKAHAADGEADDLYVGQFINSEATAGRNYGVNIQGGSNSTDHGFRVRNHGGSTQFLVKGDGNIGINETAPEELLHITHASAPAIQLEATAGGPYKSLIKMGGNDMEIRGSSGQMEFYTGNADGDSSTERVRITSDGQFNLFGGTANYIESADFRLYSNSSISAGYTGNLRLVARYNTNSTLISHSETGGTNGGSRFTFTKDCYIFVSVSQDVLGNSDTSYWSQRLVRNGSIEGYHIIRKSSQWDQMAWSQGISVNANGWIEIQWNGTANLTNADGTSWSHYNFLVWQH